jgi:hypothetical protein
MLCYCRAEDWITSPQIPSYLLENNAVLYCIGIAEPMFGSTAVLLLYRSPERRLWRVGA